MAARNLETPEDEASIYTARAEEVDTYRPLFTGDVYLLPDERLIQVLQHPCALRRGTSLVPSILVGKIRQGAAPPDWSAGHFKVMPLPQLRGEGNDYIADFIDLDLVTPGLLNDGTCIASLSLYGVNLLLQRWVHHNSRVVVPTITFTEETIGPFEEADLAAEWCYTRRAQGADAMSEFDDWIRRPFGGSTRQAMLADNQKRSVVRRQMTTHLFELMATGG